MSGAFSALAPGEGRVSTSTALLAQVACWGHQLSSGVLCWASVGVLGLLGSRAASWKASEPAGLEAVAWAGPVQALTRLSGSHLRSGQAHQLWLPSTSLGYRWCFCLMLSSPSWFEHPSQLRPHVIMLDHKSLLCYIFMIAVQGILRMNLKNSTTTVL